MYKKLKIIIFVNLFLTVIFAGFGAVIAEDQDDSVEFLGDYHITVNDIVNTKINQVYTFFDGVVERLKQNDTTVLGEIQVNLLPPAELNEETCAENLSSTCLTFLLNQEYQETASVVVRNLEQINPPAEGKSQTEVATVSEQRIEFILQELKNARNTTENTVEFYRQLLFAYPLHIELEVTAKNLKDLKGEIRKFSNILEDYPTKFHDATTVQCL